MEKVEKNIHNWYLMDSFGSPVGGAQGADAREKWLKG